MKNESKLGFLRRIYRFAPILSRGCRKSAQKRFAKQA
jgi:hypothetical protein